MVHVHSHPVMVYAVFVRYTLVKHTSLEFPELRLHEESTDVHI